jgi:hypothetical protein
MCTFSNKITSLETTQIYSCAKKLQEADRVARVRFCNWFCEAVRFGEVGILLTYFAGKAWFYSRAT